FEGYQANRTADAERAREAVAHITEGIPLGQPILVGHHSEARARRDAKKIEAGMQRAVDMWETAEYWQRRARGAVRAAKYKERADVRYRRIKGLESDKRKQARNVEDSEIFLKLWSRENLTDVQALAIANREPCGFSQCYPLADYPRAAEASQ
ncbi:hydrolase, partial [Pelomonas sp. HMWF004]